jgi:hypothetical protein
MKDEEQTNELVSQEESTEVALSPEQEARNLLDEASKSSQAILKFKEDHYHIRDLPVPLGTRHFAFVGNWEKQWICFRDKKVVERIRVRVATKKPLPARNKLSDPQLEDTDHDPWTLQNVVPFENVEIGDLVMFTTSSAGGRMAIEELAKAYSKHVLAGTARGLPIIELQIGSFPSKKFEKDISRPAFPIVDWENPVGPTIIPPEPKSTKPRTISNDVLDEFNTVEEAPPKRSSDMDDEIPF